MKKKNTNLYIYIYIYIYGSKIPGYKLENFGDTSGRAKIFLRRLHDTSFAWSTDPLQEIIGPFFRVKLQKRKVDRQLHRYQWLRMRGNLSKLTCTSSCLDAYAGVKF